LDVGVFGPLKSHWTSVLGEYKKNPKVAGIDKCDFPALLKKVLDQAKPGNNLAAAFEKCGIFPISRDKSPADPPPPHGGGQRADQGAPHVHP
jgi:hypothetical protein